MQGFNQGIQIGQQALIIGTRQLKNSFLIGRIVTVEDFWEAGEDVSRSYLEAEGRQIIYNGSADGPCAVVSSSDYKHTGKTKSGEFSMPTGRFPILVKYLMPLPPLDDQTYSEDVSVNNNKEVHA